MLHDQYYSQCPTHPCHKINLYVQLTLSAYYLHHLDCDNHKDATHINIETITMFPRAIIPFYTNHSLPYQLISINRQLSIKICLMLPKRYVAANKKVTELDTLHDKQLLFSLWTWSISTAPSPKPNRQDLAVVENGTGTYLSQTTDKINKSHTNTCFRETRNRRCARRRLTKRKTFTDHCPFNLRFGGGTVQLDTCIITTYDAVTPKSAVHVILNHEYRL
ncbi:hypothetical protein AGLY_008957 [Aphis glycines]|uniref:Uncharacterized protein n=1 Tax=Aphis glycines TaxID=307491 RepID=A0A6G0TLF0_APHGL|nr:hypothetical protein AGLY_008957 [Aphis glycines]